MSNIPLGTLITDQPPRDAIHVAIAPVSSNETLYPGQHIGLIAGSTTEVSSLAKPIGIVDPFLKHQVAPGQPFWMLLYMQTITSLHHHWEHPAFVPQVSMPTVSDRRSDAENRLREIAEALDIGYNQLLNAAVNWLECEEYEVQRDSENWRSDFPVFANEFWALYAELTGKDIPEDKRCSFFSCSC